MTTPRRIELTVRNQLLKLRTCVLLILLLGKYREYCHDPSLEHISNSHLFLPLSSRTGREEKSSSHSREVGTPTDRAKLRHTHMVLARREVEVA